MIHFFLFLLFITPFYAGNTSSSPVNHYYSRLGSISPEGDCIELHDGSHWSICPFDQNVAMQWRKKRKADEIFLITVNHSPLTSSEYPFCLSKKQESGVSSMAVSLFLAPIPDGSFTHWVEKIDNNVVTLADGSSWKVNFVDALHLNLWKKADLVLIGVDDAWWTQTENILINVRLGVYARVNKI